MNSNCYEFKKYSFDEGLLDKSVDATYIIHLKNNGRYKEIVSQIEKYKPTKTIYILFNEGFKKCKKSKHINKSNLDLVDANFQIFQHAEKEKYKNILILEDDFGFNENIKEQNVINSLNTFLKDNQNDELIYCLGIIPIIQIQMFDDHNMLLKSGGCHANIYTEKIRKTLMNDIDKIEDIDIYLNKSCFLLKRYCYYTPLCYQLFPETENQHNWQDSFSMRLAKKIIKLIKLDKQREPGYTITYILSKIFFFLFLFFFIFIFYILYNNLYLRIPVKNMLVSKVRHWTL